MTGNSSVDWNALEQAALAVRANAHAPYSNVAVGAALLAGGRIYTGCNVENAAYPVGLCAERSAIAAAVADGQRQFDALVVAARVAIPPCGMCLQALVEFGADLEILSLGENGQRQQANLSEYLPLRFDAAKLANSPLKKS